MARLKKRNISTCTTVLSHILKPRLLAFRFYLLPFSLVQTSKFWRRLTPRSALRLSAELTTCTTPPFWYAIDGSLSLSHWAKHNVRSARVKPMKDLQTFNAEDCSTNDGNNSFESLVRFSSGNHSFLFFVTQVNMCSLKANNFNYFRVVQIDQSSGFFYDAKLGKFAPKTDPRWPRKVRNERHDLCLHQAVPRTTQTLEKRKLKCKSNSLRRGLRW